MKLKSSAKLGIGSLVIILLALSFSVAAPSYVETDKYKVIFEMESGMDKQTIYITIQNKQDSSDNLDMKTLITSTNFPADLIKDSRFYIQQKQEFKVPVYKTVCDPYTIKTKPNATYPDGLTMEYTNCTSVFDYDRTEERFVWKEKSLTYKQSSNQEYKEYWENVPILRAGLEKSVLKFKLEFNTPIVETGSGWGSSGRIYLDLNNQLFYDFEHSSWWNSSYANRTCWIISNPHQAAETNVTFKLSLNMSVFGIASENCTDAEWGTTSASVGYWNSTPCNNSGETNITWWVNAPSIATDNTTQICMYYDNAADTTDSSDITTVGVFGDDFDDNDTSDWSNNYLDCGQVPPVTCLMFQVDNGSAYSDSSATRGGHINISETTTSMSEFKVFWKQYIAPSFSKVMAELIDYQTGYYLTDIGYAFRLQYLDHTIKTFSYPAQTMRSSDTFTLLTGEWYNMEFARDRNGFWYMWYKDGALNLDTNTSNASYNAFRSVTINMGPSSKTDHLLITKWCRLCTLDRQAEEEVDATPPAILMTSPTNTSYVSKSISLNVDANEIIDKWMFELNNNGTNETFTPNITITAIEGSNTNLVWANDTSGNMNYTKVVFSVDTIAPSIDLLTPDNDAWVTTDSRNVTYQYEPSSNNYANCSLYSNRTGAWKNEQSNLTEITNASTNSIYETALTQQYAEILWNVECCDYLGNCAMNDTNRSYRVDVTHPDMFPFLPAGDFINNTFTNSLDYTIYYNDSFPNGGCKIELQTPINWDIHNTSSIVNGNNTISNYSSVIGEHYYYVACWDEASNYNTSDYYNFTFDNVTPNGIGFIDPTPANNTNLSQNNFLVNGSFNDTNPFSCWLEVVNVTGTINYTMTQNTGNATVWSHNLSGQNEAVINFTLYCNDSANNIGSTGTRSIRLDITNPTITLNSPANSTYQNTGILIAMTVSDLCLDTVIYSINSYTTNTTLTTPWDIDTTGFSEAETLFDIWANDTAGNMIGKQYNFTLDDTAPGYGNLTYTNPIDEGITQWIQIDVIDLYLDTVRIEMENSNRTMSYDSGNKYKYSLLKPVVVNTDIPFIIYINDSANNLNSTTGSFTILAVGPPGGGTGGGGGGGGGGIVFITEPANVSFAVYPEVIRLYGYENRSVTREITITNYAGRNISLIATRSCPDDPNIMCIADWLDVDNSINLKTLDIPAGSTKTFGLSVALPSGLLTGNYQGSIIFTEIETDQTATTRVDIIYGTIEAQIFGLPGMILENLFTLVYRFPNPLGPINGIPKGFVSFIVALIIGPGVLMKKKDRIGWGIVVFALIFLLMPFILPPWGV